MFILKSKLNPHGLLKRMSFFHSILVTKKGLSILHSDLRKLLFDLFYLLCFVVVPYLEQGKEDTPLQKQIDQIECLLPGICKNAGFLHCPQRWKLLFRRETLGLGFGVSWIGSKRR